MLTFGLENDIIVPNYLYIILDIVLTNVKIYFLQKVMSKHFQLSNVTLA